MKIKLLMLALCFFLILVTASCNKSVSQESGFMRLNVSDTSVILYYSNAFSKNKKQEIILVFWDSIPRLATFAIGPSIEVSNKITCELSTSNLNVKFKCVGKFDETGKGTVDIADKTFNVSNGRLFLVNRNEKPLKVMQVNEQFKLPPFDDLSYITASSRFDELKKGRCLNIVPFFVKKFEYLAKNNNKVAAFLADSRKKLESSENKSKDLKKKD